MPSDKSSGVESEPPRLNSTPKTCWGLANSAFATLAFLIVTAPLDTAKLSLLKLSDTLIGSA